MRGRTWLANHQGEFNPVEVSDFEDPRYPYRLYRFLTDLEDLIAEISDDRQRIAAICPLVRQLLSSSSWLQFTPIYPDPDRGWDVLMLYDEPSFPLTVQIVTWAPGRISPIHNHGCWGLVAMLAGQEKNTFWRSLPTLSSISDKNCAPIEPVGDLVLSPGDILAFLPETIHSIEALLVEPTVSFNLYGETDYEDRFEFDPIKKTAKNF